MIAICATFTAEPLAESLRYWLNLLQLQAKIEFAPYNHVVQTLVDDQGLFALNKTGVNVVLVRFEDWARFRRRDGLDAYARSRNRELIGALQTASSRRASPIFVCICPPSPQALASPSQKELLDRLEQDLSEGLAGIPTIGDLLLRYPVDNSYDAAADQLGHIPYSPEAYAALGTVIARAYHASTRTPYKVIVTDCDNTLWRGICGEVGPRGIEIDPPSRAVQDFLKNRQRDGMLLCACSKNAVEDVEETFDAHPEMPLRRSDFVGWRVNWCPKSENIRTLAEELSLGLDSFIFLDDNPMETAEVKARCPGVLTLTLPSKLELIPRFLDHIWAFDRDAVTAEDRRRTEMYQENARRRQAVTESLSYEEFLRGLELEIEIRELRGDAEVDRAAQMTQRTNQFNFTTKRLSGAEMREKLNGGSMQSLTAFVRDRYGDYGQVGLAMYEVTDDVLQVRNFLLSCRVLGKGVEHRMLAALGQLAAARQLSAVEMLYLPTPKNTPARNFLMSFDAVYRKDSGEGFVCRLPVEVAATTRFSVAQRGAPSAASKESDASTPTSANLPATDFEWIATHHSDVKSICHAIENAGGIRRASPATDQPRNEMEKRLTRIWERVLRVWPIGIHDDFFALGGDSLLAVRVLADLQPVTERDLPLVTLVEAPTIARLAAILDAKNSGPSWDCLVAIKSSGRRPPFYCVHGIGGNVIDLVDLARHIDEDQPFYGIQALGLMGPAPESNLTVEEMAQRYIREIREFQAEGPYYLGGSSFGGLVAYEMARQLAAANIQVGLVAMFDPSVPGALNTQGVATGWRQRFDTLRYAFALHWHNLFTLPSGERIRYLREKARHLGSRVVDLPESLRSVNEAMKWAESRYIPREYSGSITLFRATEQPPWIASDRTLGWETLVKGGIEIYDTPGHHADLVRDPRARVLARQLDEALLKARYK